MYPGTRTSGTPPTPPPPYRVWWPSGALSLPVQGIVSRAPTGKEVYLGALVYQGVEVGVQTQGYQSTISLVLCGSAPGYPPPYSPLPPTGVRVLPGAELRLGVLYSKKEGELRTHGVPVGTEG